LPFEFPANQHLGSLRGWRLGRRNRWGQLLPARSFGQGPGVLPEVQVLLHGQKHVDAPVLLAASEVFPIDEPPVQEEPLEDALADLLDEVLHQLIEHRRFMSLARHDGQPGIDVSVAAQMQQTDQLVTTFPVGLFALLGGQFLILDRMIVLSEPHHHRTFVGRVVGDKEVTAVTDENAGGIEKKRGFETPAAPAR
jgi:hypothetical protein